MIGGVGGVDLAVKGTPTTADLTELLCIIIGRWPEARLSVDLIELLRVVVEQVSDSEKIPAEFFVYRNVASERAWEEHGATEMEADGLLHILIDETGVDFVVGRPEGEGAAIVSDYRTYMAKEVA